MSVKLLTEHHLEFLNLIDGSPGSSESTLVKTHIVGNHMSRLINIRTTSCDFGTYIAVEQQMRNLG